MKGPKMTKLYFNEIGEKQPAWNATILNLSPVFFSLDYIIDLDHFFLLARVTKIQFHPFLFRWLAWSII